MEVRPGSMGKSAPGMDVRIVNNMGQEVERGEQGNIGVYCRPHKPPGVFPGYIGIDKSFDCNYVGDYYVTGDRATMDMDGYIWFNSRDDDVIISAGCVQ
jgi:acyl-coenzyme A synthetase/AMP-(fatty) acid ligase